MASNQVRPKILYVITKANWGGAQRYVFDLATHAESQGYEAVVVSGPAGELTRRLTDAHIQSIRIPSLGRDISLLADIRSFFALVRIFRTQKPDIVHLNSSKIGGIGALAARVARVQKIFFTAHGWPFLENRSPMALRAIRFASWLSVLLSTHVIDISETTLKAGRSLPGVAAKLHRIYNGIDPDTPLAPRDDAQAVLARAIGKNASFFEGKVVVGTISELTRNKGLVRMFKAASKLRNLPFVFIVIGEGEERGRLENLIGEYALKERVFLAGFIADASRYLSALDIFTLTSEKEGFPFSILEAGRASLPVITSAVGGIPEIIDDTNGVLVPPRDQKLLEQAISTLVTQPIAREILGKNLHETVAQKFTREAMVRETFSLYSDLPRVS